MIPSTVAAVNLSKQINSHQMTEGHSEKDGVKSDEHIHKPILDGIKLEAHERHLKRARKRASEVHGLSDEVIKRLYGEDSK